MSILVTGGLGFIGAKVVLQLLKRNIPVVLADLDIEKNKIRLENNIDKIGKDRKLVTYQKLDITDYQNVENIFKSHKLDSVINLAYGIGLFYLIIFYKIYKNKMIDLYKSINYLGFFIILQIILGILTILNGAQIYIASLHQISSIFLVSSCIYFCYLNSRIN